MGRRGGRGEEENLWGEESKIGVVQLNGDNREVLCTGSKVKKSSCVD